MEGQQSTCLFVVSELRATERSTGPKHGSVANHVSQSSKIRSRFSPSTRAAPCIPSFSTPTYSYFHFISFFFFHSYFSLHLRPSAFTLPLQKSGALSPPFDGLARGLRLLDDAHAFRRVGEDHGPGRVVLPVVESLGRRAGPEEAGRATFTNHDHPLLLLVIYIYLLLEANRSLGSLGFREAGRRSIRSDPSCDRSTVTAFGHLRTPLRSFLGALVILRPDSCPSAALFTSSAAT